MTTSSRKAADFESPDVRNRLVGPIDDNLASLIEQRVAAELGCRPEFVTFSKFAGGSVREMAHNNEAAILVDVGGKLRQFEEVSTLFASIDKDMSELIVHLYAPYDYGDDRARKAKLKAEHGEKISGILTDMLSEREGNDNEDETS